jgi:predicted permease
MVSAYFRDPVKCISLFLICSWVVPVPIIYNLDSICSTPEVLTLDEFWQSYIQGLSYVTFHTFCALTLFLRLFKSAISTSYNVEVKAEVKVKVKVKLFLHFNWAPCHEGIGGGGVEV